jgi:hypothetical protein
VAAVVVVVADVDPVAEGTALVEEFDPIWKKGIEGSLMVLARGYDGPIEGQELDNDMELLLEKDDRGESEESSEMDGRDEVE